MERGRESQQKKNGDLAGSCGTICFQIALLRSQQPPAFVHTRTTATHVLQVLECVVDVNMMLPKLQHFLKKFTL